MTHEEAGTLARAWQRAAVNALPDREREVIEKRYLQDEDRTLEEVADTMARAPALIVVSMPPPALPGLPPLGDDRRSGDE